jgi:peptide/nickel transport system permease protein
MQRYIFKRLIQAVICMIGVSIIVFMLSRLSGDPLDLMMPPESTKEDWDIMRTELGLDKPIYVQYARFVAGAVQGDFGESIRWEKPCFEIFWDYFPNTLLLGSAAMAFSLMIGIPFGIVSAVRVNTWVDGVGKVFALLGQSLPVFWVGIMLILIFAVNLRVLPTSGMTGWENILMPAFTLGWYFTAAQTRLTRSAMLDVLDSEYIKLARMKGLPERAVVLKHAFKNAVLPVITMAALNFIVLLNGTVITETIFAWPGVGRLVVQAIFARDYPLVQTCVFIASALFVLANLVVDILYMYLDSRIRYQ